MRHLIFLTALLLASANMFAQNEFMLGSTGMYPEGNRYDVTQYTDWSWYGELSMNFWQGFYLGDNHTDVMS